MKENDFIVQLSVLAEALNVSPRRINQLVKEGYLEKVEHGKYDLIECFQKFLKFQKGSDDGIDKAKLRKANADADKAEMDVALTKDVLVEVDDVEKAWADVGKIISKGVLGLAPKVAPLIAGEKSIRVIKETIDVEAREILKAVSYEISNSKT